MAKRKRYEGKNQWEIEELKQQRRSSLIFAAMFMLMILAGILVAGADSCGESADDQTDITSGTSIVETVSGTELQ